MSSVLSFDGDPTLQPVRCSECDQDHDASTGYILQGGSAFAVYWANWYPHAGEAWVDMAMGSWIEPDYADHVTFGCRIGAIGDDPTPQCSLVPAAETRSSNTMFGTKLSRDGALVHEWLPTFWSTIDWLMTSDPLLHKHVFHMGEAEDAVPAESDSSWSRLIPRWIRRS